MATLAELTAQYAGTLAAIQDIETNGQASTDGVNSLEMPSLATLQKRLETLSAAMASLSEPASRSGYTITGGKIERRY